ncbi:MAG: PAS domain S-box protein [Chlorobi bacterium]|nr:PAS domain S-box protein [Chlorobiota bacterium]
MKKIILELLNKYYDQIRDNWINKIESNFGDKLSKAQIKTFVEASLNTLIDVVKTSQYLSSDQYLIDSYLLFSKSNINLLEVSQIYSFGRFALLHNIDKSEEFNYDPIIIIGFLDEIIEQVFARYSLLYQSAQTKELKQARKRLEHKLEVNQRYLRTILHKSDTAIAVIDNNEKFIAWNKGAEKIFGYTEKEVIGKPATFLLPRSEKFMEELDYIKREIDLTGDVKILDTERVTKFGKTIPVQLTVTQLPSSDGKSDGRTIIIQDKSQVKQLQQQIDQSEKLAVIGQLAAGVAHEIGNPLASISSLVQLMQRKNEDEQLSEQLKTIKENIDRISKIVRELVDFSRPPGEDKVLLAITDVLKTAVGIVKYDERVKNVEFITDMDSELPLINIVPDQLLQVFVNILINALDAIEGEGEIEVKTYLENSFICIDIKDNGCGMTQEVINKIFDPFYTTKSVGKGTGLGLSVSYGIIKKLNGNITVKSKLNEGSIFTIKLPTNRN